MDTAPTTRHGRLPALLGKSLALLRAIKPDGPSRDLNLKGLKKGVAGGAAPNRVELRS
jgi:hypothetical protein